MSLCDAQEETWCFYIEIPPYGSYFFNITSSGIFSSGCLGPIGVKVTSTKKSTATVCPKTRVTAFSAREKEIER